MYVDSKSLALYDFLYYSTYKMIYNYPKLISLFKKKKLKKKIKIDSFKVIDLQVEFDYFNVRIDQFQFKINFFLY